MKVKIHDEREDRDEDQCVERLDNSRRALAKHGRWTDAGRIELRGHRGATTLGLRHLP